MSDFLIYLATESCGCFVGIEEEASFLVGDWQSWGLIVSRVTSAEAEKMQREVMCREHKQRRAA